MMDSVARRSAPLLAPRGSDDGRLLLLRLESLKRRGDQSAKSENFRDAIDRYTEALDLLSSVAFPHSSAGSSAAWKQIQSELMPALLSNRSWALSAAGRYAAALADATQLRLLRPGWSKAHYRTAKALEGLRRYPEAARQYVSAYKLETDALPASDCLKGAGNVVLRLTSHELALELLAMARATMLTWQHPAEAGCPPTLPDRDSAASSGLERLPSHRTQASLHAKTEAAWMVSLAALRQHASVVSTQPVLDTLRAIIWQGLRQPQKGGQWPAGAVQGSSLYTRYLAWLRQGRAPQQEAALLLAAVWQRSGLPDTALDAAACAALQLAAATQEAAAAGSTESEQEQQRTTRSTAATDTTAEASKQESLADQLSEAHYVLGSTYLQLAAKASRSSMPDTRSPACSDNRELTAANKGVQASGDGWEALQLQLCAVRCFANAVKLAPGFSSYQGALLQATAAAGDGDAARTACLMAERQGPLVVVLPPWAATDSQDSSHPMWATQSGCSGQDSDASDAGNPEPALNQSVEGQLAFPGRTARDLTRPAREVLLRCLRQAAGAGDMLAINARIEKIQQVENEAYGSALVIQFQVHLNGADPAVARQLLAALQPQQPCNALPGPAHMAGGTAEMQSSTGPGFKAEAEIGSEAEAEEGSEARMEAEAGAGAGAKTDMASCDDACASLDAAGPRSLFPLFQDLELLLGPLDSRLTGGQLRNSRSQADSRSPTAPLQVVPAALSKPAGPETPTVQASVSASARQEKLDATHATSKAGPVAYCLTTMDGRHFEGAYAGMPKHPFGLSRVYYDQKELPSMQAWCQMADGSCRWRQSASEIQIIALKVPRNVPAMRLLVNLGPHTLLIKDKLTGQTYLEGKLYRGVLPVDSFWTVETDDMLTRHASGNEAAAIEGLGGGQATDDRTVGQVAAEAPCDDSGAGCLITLCKMNLELLARSWRHADTWWPRLLEGHADISWDEYDKDYSDLPQELRKPYLEAAARRQQGQGLDDSSGDD